MMPILDPVKADGQSKRCGFIQSQNQEPVDLYTFGLLYLWIYNPLRPHRGSYRNLEEFVLRLRLRLVASASSPSSLRERKLNRQNQVLTGISSV